MSKCTPFLLLGLLLVAGLPAHAALTGFVQLSWPQSDDELHYMRLAEQRTLPVMGFVAATPAVASVLVNGVPADLTPADFSVLGAPAGMPSWGFRAPLVLDPDEPIVVAVTDVDGDAREFRYIPDSGAALARLRELRRLQAENSWLELDLANALVFADDYDAAFPLYDDFVVRYPRFGFGFFFGGLAYRDIDDWGDADDWFRRAYDRDDRFWWARLERGEVLGRRGDWDGAEREYREVLSRHPELAEGHWRLGEALMARGRDRDAERELQTAVTRDPKLVPAHTALARVLQVQGRQPEAAQELQRATQLKPTYAGANYQMGRVLQAQGKLPEAQQSYQKALQATPQMATARAGMGSVLEQQGKPAEAARQYNMAVQSNPQYGEARNGLVRTYMQQKQYPAAWQTIRQGEPYGYQPEGKMMGQLRAQMPAPKVSAPVPMERAPSRYGRR